MFSFKPVLFFVAFLAIAVQIHATDVRVGSSTVTARPYGNIILNLHTRNNDVSGDTLAAQNDNNIYGPYKLCNRNEKMPEKFTIQADAATGTTPVIAFDYQIVGGTSITDTIAGDGAWVAADTIAEAGIIKDVTIVGAGNAIVFRANNYDATGSQIPGMLRIVIPAATTINK